MKNMKLLIIPILAIFLILVILFAVWYNPIQSNSLCKLIKVGETEEALVFIEKMNEKQINTYSAPLFLRWMYNMVENDIDLPLVRACEEDNDVVVEALLKKGADPNKFLTGGWSPIEATFVKTWDHRLEIAKLLIEYGADVNLYGSGRQPPLFFTIDTDTLEEEERSNQLVTLFMDNGANPINENNGNSILHTAVRSNSALITENLINNYHLPVDEIGEKGKTPLMWGARENSLGAVKLLLEHGADKSIKDNEGKTAYNYAIEGGNREVAELLKPD